MNVRSTIYTIKYGLVIGVASYTLQYATKYIIDFKIIRLIILRANHILSLVGLFGILIAFVAFIAEMAKRSIKRDNFFNLFKAFKATRLVKKALLRVDEINSETGKTNFVSKSFNNCVRWSYADFEHNKMLVKAKIPFNGQARKMWQENKDAFVDAITSQYPEYNFSHEKERGYYVLVGIKSKN